MTNPENEDEAVRARLARLRNQPVNTSGVERKLDAEIGRWVVGSPAATVGGPRWLRRLGWAAVWAVAACALAVVGWWSRSSVLDAPAIAALHREISEHHSHAVSIETFEALNRELARDHPSHPVVPTVTGAELRAYCIRKRRGCEVVCVHLRVNGERVTMVVADPAKVRAPRRSAHGSGDRVPYAVPGDGCNVVFLAQEGRWLALAGETTSDTLMKLASSISQPPP